MTSKYTRLYCGSCGKVLGWREARDDTRWILALCDDCYDEKDKANMSSASPSSSRKEIEIAKP